MSTGTKSTVRQIYTSGGATVREDRGENEIIYFHLVKSNDIRLMGISFHLLYFLLPSKAIVLDYNNT